MSCCSQCQGIEKTFSPRYVERELRAYRRKGPDKTTQVLIDALKQHGVAGASVLDIGGGVGAIQHGLLAAGAARAVSVEASSAYAEVARREAQARGLADRITAIRGNFVEVAPTLDQADIVTLDRVICCFDDMPALVGASSARAGRLFGAVYPRDTWLIRALLGLQNLIMRIFRRQMRFFAHPTHEVDALVRAHGLEPRFYRRMGAWQVVVYGRG